MNCSSALFPGSSPCCCGGGGGWEDGGGGDHVQTTLVAMPLGSGDLIEIEMDMYISRWAMVMGGCWLNGCDQSIYRRRKLGIQSEIGVVMF